MYDKEELSRNVACFKVVTLTEFMSILFYEATTT